MMHGCTFMFVSPLPLFTLGAGRGPSASQMAWQSLKVLSWEHLHRLQYCMRWCLNPAMFALQTPCKLTSVRSGTDSKTPRTVIGFDELTAAGDMISKRKYFYPSGGRLLLDMAVVPEAIIFLLPAAVCVSPRTPRPRFLIIIF
jgi:hypothetical protein